MAENEGNLDKLLEGMTEDEVKKLARENRRRYILQYYAKKELKRKIDGDKHENV